MSNPESMEIDHQTIPNPESMQIDDDLHFWTKYSQQSSQFPKVDLKFKQFKNLLTIVDIYKADEHPVFYSCNACLPNNIKTPLSFSQKDVINEYRDKFGKTLPLYKCTAAGPIQLADIRILRHIAVDMLLDMQDRYPSEINNIETGINCFLNAFGLCNYSKQQEFFQQYKYNINKLLNTSFEVRKFYLSRFGFRISISENEAIAVNFVSKLFDHNVLHGYIAPELLSPLNYLKDSSKFMHNELCLFKPNECNFQSEDISGKSKRRRNMDGGTINEWEDLENLIDKPLPETFEFQCSLSNNHILRGFMMLILSKLTNILYDAFYVNTNKTTSLDEKENRSNRSIIKSIKLAYLPTIKLIGNTMYILKPGMEGLLDNNVVEKLLNKDLTEETNSRVRQRPILADYSLSEMMGAIYGIVTHNGMFGLILRAHSNIAFNIKYPFIGQRVNNINKTLKLLFNLPETFDVNQMLNLLEEVNVLKNQNDAFEVVKGGPIGMLLDMMIYNPYATNYSIVRRNITNQEYIRTRKQKSTNYDTFEKTRPSPSCPVFGIAYQSISTPNVQAVESISVVDGDEWYTVQPTNVFAQMMNKYKRTYKAGPSGSTFMWMNLVFDLLSIPKSPKNYEILLLCIIADFVPIYHSLTEILLVYSQERDYKDEHMYTMDKNPAEWLVKTLVESATDRAKRSGKIVWSLDTSKPPSIKKFTTFITRSYTPIKTPIVPNSSK